MTSGLPKTSVAETLAEKIVALKAGALPATTMRKCEDLLIDVVGLCVTARNQDYVASALAGWDDDGPCTAIGHARTLTAAGAAFVNGTAAHGEDFDDTFEGGPVHAGAVIVSGPPDAPGIPLLADRPMRNGAGTAYVCRGFVCDAPVSTVDAVARVAVNLRGIERHELRRGDALLTPQQFHRSDTIDVRVHGADGRHPSLDVVVDAGLRRHRRRLGHAVADGDLAASHVVDHALHDLDGAR